MKKTVEFLRADVVNANGYYYPLKTLKKFKKNGIELYLSPAITGRLNGNETIIESGKPTFFTVKPASKWRKPFLDE